METEFTNIIMKFNIKIYQNYIQISTIMQIVVNPTRRWYETCRATHEKPRLWMLAYDKNYPAKRAEKILNVNDAKRVHMISKRVKARFS